MEKILYAGKKQDSVGTLKNILNHMGFKIDTAYSGEECIKKAKENFDLILLDTMLPDMSAWSVFTKLKEKASPKFIFLSPIPISSERRKELKKAGISDYIIKPFAEMDLICKIIKLLEK